MTKVAERVGSGPRDSLATASAHLRFLVAIQRELATTIADLPTLMSLIVTQAQELTGAAGVMIEVPEQEALVCHAATGSASTMLGARGGLNDGISGLSFQTGRTLQFDDVAADSHVDHALCDRIGLRSAIVVPLESSRTRFGVLTVVSPQPSAFGNEQRELLQLLGGIVATRLDLVEQQQARQVLLTEKTIAITTLRESESKFRNAFVDSGIGMALVASDGSWLKVNGALCRTLGYSPQELLGGNFRSITHADDRDLDRDTLDRMLTGDMASYELEKRCLHKSGTVVWILLTVSSVRDTAGQPLYFIAQIQDITSRKQAEDALHRLAIRDDLTGLYNRREMNRLLRDELARANRHQRPLSLMMLDVDYFKRINDTHGHQVGDRALVHVAQIIDDSVRGFDRVARYGGEEFAVVLPETSAVDAFVVAERIRARISKQPFEFPCDGGEATRVNMTVSIGVATAGMATAGLATAGVATTGVATLEAQNASKDDLIRDADRALYSAKQSGRNRCVATPTDDVDRTTE